MVRLASCWCVTWCASHNRLAVNNGGTMEYYIVASGFDPGDPVQRKQMRNLYLPSWENRVAQSKAFQQQIRWRESHDGNDKIMLRALADQLERLESAIYIVREKLARGRP